MTDKSEEVEMTAEDADPAKALAEAQAQADKYLDMARRLQADFDNYRKRTQRENEEFRKYACSSIVGDLLTVVDDLDRAGIHAQWKSVEIFESKSHKEESRNRR